MSKKGVTFGLGVTSTESHVDYEFIFHSIAKGVLLLTNSVQT